MFDNLHIYWNKITWAYPYMLILLAAVPVLYWYVFLRKHKQSTIILSTTQGLRSHRTWKHLLLRSLPIMRMLAISALIVALARPQQVDTRSWVDSDGIDIMLCIDVSWSMMSEDFKPNRLKVAAELSEKFVDKRVGDRIGLVEFSGESFLLSPVSIDHQMVIDQLRKLQSGKLKDGTAIGDGLATSIDKLKDLDAKSKIIILLTDGDENAGYINAQTALEIAKAFGIKIYTVGVGSDGKALMPVPQADGTVEKRLVDVTLDTGLLKRIASETGGKYYRASNESKLKSIYDDIDQLEKTNLKMQGFANVVDLFMFLVLFAFVLLVLEWVIRFGILKTIS